jgi:hypothetical protein
MPRKLYVTKASGETEPFSPAKIKRTCLRAGATEQLAAKVTRKVAAQAYPGISTKAILKLTLSLLEKEMPQVAARYDLKGAIMRLGPAGFAFEALIAGVLKEHNYAARTRQVVQGASVKHEIDIIAAKPIRAPVGLAQPPLKWYMIECKYHRAPGIFTGLKETLYTYARFLDLRDGWKAGKCQRFDQAWLITNTKFSRDAIQYGTKKNIKLLGWKYPAGNSLEIMLEEKKLYPITVLRQLDPVSLRKFAASGLMLCRDLVRKDIEKLRELTGLSQRKLRLLAEAARQVLTE